jgi:hypothetical protein
MLFLVVSTPRPERPAEVASSRQSFWPWIASYQESGICRHVYARAGRGAVAVFDVASNEALHLILNEWADIIPGILIPTRSSILKRRSACLPRKQQPRVGDKPAKRPRTRLSAFGRHVGRISVA